MVNTFELSVEALLVSSLFAASEVSQSLSSSFLSKSFYMKYEKSRELKELRSQAPVKRDNFSTQVIVDSKE